MNRNETLIYACILTLLCGFSLAPASSKGAKDTPHGVSIKGMQFVPDKLEINVGDTVVWTNRDDGHNLDHQWCVRWVFKDGKIVEGRHFASDQYAVDEFFGAG